MKIKKALALPISIFISLSASENNFIEKTKTPQIDYVQSSNTLDTIEDTATEITPLEFATNNLRSFIKNYDITLLKNRSYDPTLLSKTAIFNKSFIEYIKHVYNEPDYAAMLSQKNIHEHHICEFLKICQEMNLSRSTAYECLRLFFNKIKCCEIIDDQVILDIAITLPESFSSYFKENTNKTNKNTDFIKKNIEHIILSKLTDDFNYFQDKPENFVSDLAISLTMIQEDFFHEQTIINQKNLDIIESCNRLRTLVLRFFEVIISKAMWNYTQENNCWRSFILLGEELKNLGSQGIIDHMDDLDDLWWSLIHRFCFFIELTGASLSTHFYEQAETDIASGAISFLEIAEQDDGITTKKETLCRALMQGKIKSTAQKNGFHL